MVKRGEGTRRERERRDVSTGSKLGQRSPVTSRTQSQAAVRTICERHETLFSGERLLACFTLH